MANYFVLKCMPSSEADYYRLQAGYPATDKRWEAGLLFSDQNRSEELQPPPVPIPLTTEPEEEGLPNVYAELYWNPIPLMSRRLVAALRAAGVDNFQTYDTRLESVEGKKPPPKDNYLAVNIVGRVAAADLAKSKSNPETTETIISMDFNSLAVDEAKARDFLLFRLAENITAVLVHARVKEQVDASGIDTLTWLAPEEWAG
jgi:hypothetical protein